MQDIINSGQCPGSQATVVVVMNTERIHQLMALCTFQPQLSAVVNDLLMQSGEGAEFYLQVRRAAAGLGLPGLLLMMNDDDDDDDDDDA